MPPRKAKRERCPSDEKLSTPEVPSESRSKRSRPSSRSAKLPDDSSDRSLTSINKHKDSNEEKDKIDNSTSFPTNNTSVSLFLFLPKKFSADLDGHTKRLKKTESPPDPPTWSEPTLEKPQCGMTYQRTNRDVRNAKNEVVAYIRQAYTAVRLSPTSTAPFYEYLDSHGTAIDEADFALDTHFQIPSTRYRVIKQSWMKYHREVLDAVEAYGKAMQEWRKSRIQWELRCVETEFNIGNIFVFKNSFTQKDLVELRPWVDQFIKNDRPDKPWDAGILCCDDNHANGIPVYVAQHHMGKEAFAPTAVFERMKTIEKAISDVSVLLDEAKREEEFQAICRVERRIEAEDGEPQAQRQATRNPTTEPQDDDEDKLFVNLDFPSSEEEALSDKCPLPEGLWKTFISWITERHLHWLPTNERFKGKSIKEIRDMLRIPSPKDLSKYQNCWSLIFHDFPGLSGLSHHKLRFNDGKHPWGPAFTWMAKWLRKNCPEDFGGAKVIDMVLAIHFKELGRKTLIGIEESWFADGGIDDDNLDQYKWYNDLLKLHQAMVEGDVC